MEWTRSETLALAMHRCVLCHGSGLRLTQKGLLEPCNCVLRAIFRICFNRFEQCITQQRHLSRVGLEPHTGHNRSESWGRKDEEFIADFCLISRRTLDDEDYRLFRYHFLLGADWKLCARKLQVERGSFFHAVYRVEHKLGRIFRELEPYGLFPVEDYYNGPPRSIYPVRRAPVTVMPLWAGPLSFPPIGRTA